MTEKKLTAKQKAFCEEYMIDLNATQAAIRAGYSKDTAQEQSSRLLSNVMVQEYVSHLQEARSKRTEITADRVIKELGKLAFGNISNLYNEAGELAHPQKLPEEVSATITEVTERSLGGEDPMIERKYKVADKKASLELLGRHLSIFNDKVKVEQTHDIDKLEAAMEKLKLAGIDLEAN
jgi:phage terminase small subunit